MTDTDSLIYLVKTENVYDDIFSSRDMYDLANFPKTSKYFDCSNNKVIGKFKDECSGEPILEFIGLRPKMYSFLTVHDANSAPLQPVEKHRAKGIASAASKLLRHADFRRQLDNPSENLQINRRIGSKLHIIYTIELKKRGLCAFDDKRFLLADGINSLAFGHVDIQNEVVYEEPEERHAEPCVTQPDIPQPSQDDDIAIEGADPLIHFTEARISRASYRASMTPRTESEFAAADTFIRSVEAVCSTVVSFLTFFS